jgi:hypothetical protein
MKNFKAAVQKGRFRTAYIPTSFLFFRGKLGTQYWETSYFVRER